MKNTFISILVLWSLISFSQLFSQDVTNNFLRVNTNPATIGFGEIGVVSTDARYDLGLEQNPALIQHAQRVMAGHISYNQGSRFSGGKNANFFQGGFIYGIKDNQTLGLSVRYFSNNGLDIFSPTTGQRLEPEHIYESQTKLSYARKLKKHWTLGTALGFSKANVVDFYLKDKRNTLNLDFGASYKNQAKIGERMDLNYSWGFSLLNLGSRINFNDTLKQYGPATLKTGVLIGVKRDNGKNLFFMNGAYQLDKLLVPSQGEGASKSSFAALFSSFGDSPRGFEGELEELLHHMGLEERWNFNGLVELTIRQGLLLNARKNTFNQLSAGVGLAVKGIYFDYAYRRLFLGSNIIDNAIGRDVSYFSLGYQKIL